MNTTITRRVEYLPRSRRRLVVAVALAGYPAAVAVLAGLKHTSLNRGLILALFLLVLLFTVAALAVGYRYARGRIDGRGARLDANNVLPATIWVIVYIPALPSLMLAWIETDQPADA